MAGTLAVIHMLETNIIITNKNRNVFHFWRNIVATFLVFYVYFMRRYNRNETLSDSFTKWELAILIVTLIALLLLFILSKKRKRIGRIGIGESTISIKINSENKEYNLVNLTNLKIFRYEEEKKENSALTSLISNAISFNFGGTDFTYQFEISSNYQDNILKKIVESWKEKGYLGQFEQPLTAGLAQGRPDLF